MPWNGLGVFTPPGSPEFPAIPNDLIRAAYYNVVIEALCDAFLNTVPRDGQAALTGNMDAGGFTIRNLRAAAANGEPVRFNEFTELQQEVDELAASIEPFVYLNMGII